MHACTRFSTVWQVDRRRYWEGVKVRSYIPCYVVWNAVIMSPDNRGKKLTVRSGLRPNSNSRKSQPEAWSERYCQASWRGGAARQGYSEGPSMEYDNRSEAQCVILFVRKRRFSKAGAIFRWALVTYYHFQSAVSVLLELRNPFADNTISMLREGIYLLSRGRRSLLLVLQFPTALASS